MEGNRDFEKLLDGNKKQGRMGLLQKFGNAKESKIVNQKKEIATLLIQRYIMSYSSNKKLYESICTDETKP